jgi:queuine tRNA-ribosyltransferase
LNLKWAEEKGWFDEGSVFPVTERYSAAYLRHLFKAGEPFGARLASLHNIWFYGRMMQEIRDAIEKGTWPDLMARYAHA